jgi:S1-C subfamily serine protease
MPRLTKYFALGLLIFLLAPPLPAPAEDSEVAEEGRFSPAELETLNDARKFERELVRVVEKVRPASVSIENWQERGGVVRPAGQGSGVIISSKGYILTNQHVVQGAKEIWVSLYDHKRYKATLVGNDPRGDVALLKISGSRFKYKDPKRGRPDRLSAGEWVIATGNPFGLAADGEPVVTFGVVSGLERILPGQFFYGDAIQHDAKINPGNSGGPLWDTNGNLLGINGKIAFNSASGAGPSSSGVGYTIPIDQIRNFLEAMFEGRPVQHGDEILGIEKVKTHYDDDGTADGAVVTKVRDGSPAALARSGGVQVGDVVVKITVSGKPYTIRTLTDLITRLSPLAEGSKLSLVVVRGRKRIVIPNIELVLPKKPKRPRR